MAIDPHIQDLLTTYQAQGPDSQAGIPTELYQYAQANPGALIDRSGWNNAPTATSTNPNLNFNFSNPLPGQTQGVDWFPTDDRNNLGLQTQLSGGSNPYSLSPAAGGGNSIPGAAGAVFGGGPQTNPTTGQSTGAYPPASNPTSGTPSAGGSTTPTAPGGSATPTTPSPYDLTPIMQQYGLASQQLTGQALPAIQDILAKMNTGFTPEVLSALRSQSTSAIPKQYEDAARAMRTNLLRTGAAGAGELPASGADLLRTFGPLEQARNEAVAGANRSTILANQAEIARNQGRGQEAINSLIQGQATLNSVINQSIQSGTQLKLADMDIQTRLKLAQMGIDSDEKLANLKSQTELSLGGLDAATRLTIANLDTDTQKWMGTLNTDTQKQIAQLASSTNTNIANLDNATKLKIADIENAPGSLKNILLASLLGTATSGSGGGILGKGLDALLGIFKGGSNDPESGAFKYPTIGGDAAGAIGGAVGGGTGGAGAAITGLLTNPITIGIGAAIATAIIWSKSQAHHEADTFVQTYQNPFDKQMASLNQQFWDLAQSGKLTRDQAQQIRTAVQGFTESYDANLTKFASQGSDEKKVAGQAANTRDYWYGPNYSKFLGAMDGAIAGLAA